MAFGLQAPDLFYHFIDETIYTMEVLYTVRDRTIDIDQNMEVVNEQTT